MAVTIASLRTAYPEFTTCPDSTLNAAITNAMARCDEDVLVTHYDLAVTLLACHYASIGPFGIDLRLQKNETKTSYFEMWERIARAAGKAYRVV